MHAFLLNILILLIASTSLISQTTLRGSLTGSKALTKNDNPVFITSDLTIESNAALLIGPGVIITPSEGVNVIVKGRIIASGELDDAIYFGNETNKWGGIQLLSTQRSEFQSVEFINGGGSKTQNSLIMINAGEPIFEYCRFKGDDSNLLLIQRDGSVDLGSKNSKGFNRFYPPQGRLALFNKTKADINASNNCWVIPADEIIDDYIYDESDNDNYGVVNYQPAVDCSYDPAKVVELLQPHENAELFTGETIFSWTRVKDCQFYILEISSDSLFNEIDYYQTPDTSWSFDLQKTGKLYWRVISVFDKSDQYISNVFEINVSRIILPLEIYSKDTIINNSCVAELTWSNEIDVNYQIEVTLDASQQRILIDSLSSNTYTSSFGEDFKWRVRAVAEDAISLWSEYAFVKHTQGFTDSYDLPVELQSIYQIGDKDLITFNNYLILIHDEISLDTIDLNSNIRSIKRANKSEDIFNVFTEQDVFKVILINDQLVSQRIYDQINNITDILQADITSDYGSENILLLDSNTISINNGENNLRNELLDANYSKILAVDFENDGKTELLIINENSIKEVILDDEFSTNLIFEGEVNVRSIKSFINNGLMNIAFKSNGNLILLSYRDNKATIDIPLTDLGDFSFGIGDLDQDVFADVYWTSIEAPGVVYQGDIREREILLNRIDSVDLYDPIFLSRKSNKIRFLSIENEKGISFYQFNCFSNENNRPYDLESNFIGNSLELNWKKGQNNYYSQVKLVSKKDFSETLIFVYTNKLLIDTIPIGDYYYCVRELRFDGTFSEWSQNHDLSTPDQATPPPDSWNYSSLTGGNSLIVIENPETYALRDRNLKAGDALGVFFKDGNKLVCGGYSIIQNGVDNIITAWVDNSNTDNIKDGFEKGDKYIFKVWDHQKEDDFIVKAHFMKGPDSFLEDTISYIGAISFPDTSSISIKKGWNFISFDMDLIDTDPSSLVFDPRDVIIDSEYKSFRNGSIDNSLELIDPTSAYQYYSISNKEILLEGWEFDKRDAVEYYKNEWLLLPVLYGGKTIGSYLNETLDDILIVKDVNGNVYFPDQFIDQIQTTNELSALKVLFKNDGSFQIPEIQELTSFDDKLKLDSKTYCDTTVKGANMHIYLTIENPEQYGRISIIDGVGNTLNCINDPEFKNLITIWERGSEVNIPQKEDLRIFLNDEAGNNIIYELEQVIYGSYADELHYERDSFVKINIDDLSSIYKNKSSSIIQRDGSIRINDLKVIDLICVYNLLGDLVIDQKINSRSTTLNTENFNNGVYFLLVNSGNSQELHRISIVK